MNILKNWKKWLSSLHNEWITTQLNQHKFCIWWTIVFVAYATLCWSTLSHITWNLLIDKWKINQKSSSVQLQRWNKTNMNSIILKVKSLFIGAHLLSKVARTTWTREGKHSCPAVHCCTRTEGTNDKDTSSNQILCSCHGQITTSWLLSNTSLYFSSALVP